LFNVWIHVVHILWLKMSKKIDIRKSRLVNQYGN
jgi:hypothetical protein